MRRIGVVTTSRSDYSSLLPLLRLISDDPELELLLFVGGMHLLPEYGSSIREIEGDGFPIADRVQMLLASNTREAVAKSIGLGVMACAESFSRFRPDLLLIVGDRFELLSVACAALPLAIPIAHVSGGDATEGLIDNQVRYAVTKLSHLHFVAMESHAQRLLQMGEEPWRVHVTGDPALDLIRQIRVLSREELAASLHVALEPPVVVVTMHPTTLGSYSVLEEVSALLAALSRVPGTLIFTYPNADPESRTIIEHTRAFTTQRPGAALFFNLGQQRYYSLLTHADLMVGNSSSAAWEAPTFRLPAVNIGERQRGRLSVGNVIHAAVDAHAIERAIRRGMDPAFRASLRDLQNPYGDGHAAPRIVGAIKDVERGPVLLQKRFHSFVSQPVFEHAGPPSVAL
ncbi:MAG: UDP-N-acetyl-D-glucosamine 2-epimerase, UDP-hydrolysing [Omnitrophica bacterium RIFCSPHIGHO2_02_FULL_63_14]|nr:MAG: UDP-N-acetyl-D-glucosamine 2-epimerase, UDP-hydrolysing [Omnitrophica bacterium RIFCSPHIGHO2_02_FULL_63_14]